MASLNQKYLIFIFFSLSSTTTSMKAPPGIRGVDHESIAYSLTVLLPIKVSIDERPRESVFGHTACGIRGISDLLFMCRFVEGFPYGVITNAVAVAGESAMITKPLTISKP